MTSDPESTKTDHEATLALLRRQPPPSRLRVRRRRGLRRREVRAQALGVGEQLLGVRRCGAGAGLSEVGWGALGWRGPARLGCVRASEWDWWHEEFCFYC